MTQPITVHPTEHPELCRTEDGRGAVQPTLPPWSRLYCAHCLTILDVPSHQHWLIGGLFYHENCVVVADQEDAP